MLLKVIADVAKRNRFDIFGFFEKTNDISVSDQKALSEQIKKQYLSAHPENTATVKSYTLRGSELEVILEVK